MAADRSPRRTWRDRLLALTIFGIGYLGVGFHLLAVGAVRPTIEQWTVIAPSTGIAAMLVASGWIERKQSAYLAKRLSDSPRGRLFHEKGYDPEQARTHFIGAGE